MKKRYIFGTPVNVMTRGIKLKLFVPHDKHHKKYTRNSVGTAFFFFITEHKIIKM